MSIKKFKPSSEDKERLSESEAHEEADMLRAQLEINPKTGKIPTSPSEKVMSEIGAYDEGGREPKPEDYDAALAAVEELRKIAEDVPTTEKVLNVFGRLSADAASLLIYMWKSGIKGEQMWRAGSDWSKIDAVEGYKKEHFDDAAYKLRELKKRAKRFGEQEARHNEK